MNTPDEMYYNPERDRWTVDYQGHPCELHCGIGFDLIVGYYYLNCTLEFGNCWYVFTEGVRFNLNKKQRYQVIL
ncbi:hypothetical protein E4665_17955 [Sporolactobacillus shoreae]|uniref:DUF5348 domain-containing protein n=1 Tax=Sporolactobacillus shoreae TaxID=1465501 RepID=A0A4Z0GI97_9BACL|nr:DUF5348 domain-containing protein [Sporolactobacillus shoreae]TGA95475.1 hypothetical protein E4665_17955 [Sporolactobacillus shoreae]